jgi:hypothetical protein
VETPSCYLVICRYRVPKSQLGDNKVRPLSPCVIATSMHGKASSFASFGSEFDANGYFEGRSMILVHVSRSRIHASFFLFFLFLAGHFWNGENLLQLFLLVIRLHTEYGVTGYDVDMHKIRPCCES